MKCFYHRTDLDGRGAGAIVRYFHPECEMIGMDYKEPFPWDTVAKGEKIFMVDFSLATAEMKRLSEHADFIWMDHHTTSILECSAAGITTGGLQAFDRSSVELTWEFFNPGAPYPEVVYHLGRHDRWDHTDIDTLKVHYGMRLHNTDPTNGPFWSAVLTNFGGIMQEIVADGDKIQRYVQSEYADYAHEAAFTVQFEGLNFLAVNRGLAGSLIVEPLFDKKKHDAVMLFYWQGDSWRFSLYAATDKKEGVNLAPIAKKYGGGGQAVAAGFRLPAIPFDMASTKKIYPS